MTLAAQHLERVRAAERDVLDAVHGAHAALAERLGHAVVADHVAGRGGCRFLRQCVFVGVAARSDSGVQPSARSIVTTISRSCSPHHTGRVALTLRAAVSQVGDKAEPRDRSACDVFVDGDFADTPHLRPARRTDRFAAPGTRAGPAARPCRSSGLRAVMDLLPRRRHAHASTHPRIDRVLRIVNPLCSGDTVDGSRKLR